MGQFKEPKYVYLGNIFVTADAKEKVAQWNVNESTGAVILVQGLIHKFYCNSWVTSLCIQHKSNRKISIGTYSKKIIMVADVCYNWDYGKGTGQYISIYLYLYI